MLVFVALSQLISRNLALYVISVRRTRDLLTASFRFYLTIAPCCSAIHFPLSGRVRNLHSLECAHGAQTQKGVQVSLLTRHNNIHILPLIPFNDYPHFQFFRFFIRSLSVVSNHDESQIIPHSVPIPVHSV